MKYTFEISSPALGGWAEYEADAYEIHDGLIYLFDIDKPPEGSLAVIEKRRLVAVFRLDGLTIMENDYSSE